MELDDFSRFKTTEPTIIEGKETFGVWRPLKIFSERPAEEFIAVFEVTSALEGRPDLISFSVYGTPYLDWVLIAFNQVRETLNWPATGDIIEVPSDVVVLPELL